MRRLPTWPGLRWVRAALSAAAQTGLHECRSCGREMVFAADRLQVDEHRWKLRLRCGGCGSMRDAEATTAEAADFDATVAAHRASIAHELARLEAARMAEDVERFAEALRRDLIDPADFEPRLSGSRPGAPRG